MLVEHVPAGIRLGRCRIGAIACRLLLSEFKLLA